MDKPFQGKKHKVHKFEKKAGKSYGHHLTPSERGGETIGSNLLLMDYYRHMAWHLLFMNSTLNEVIRLFQQAKSNNVILHLIFNYYKYPAFKLLFGSKTRDEILELLLRVKKIKEAQRYRYKLAG